MNIRNYVLFFLLLSFSWQVDAQKTFFFIGRIKDAQTHQVITTANIINLKNNRGAMSNQLGYFMLQVNDKDYIKISYVGYNNLYYQVDTQVTDTLDFYLRRKIFHIDEVEVFPWTKKEFKVQFVEMDTPLDSNEWLFNRINLSVEELKWLTPAGLTINYKTRKERQQIKVKAFKRWAKKDKVFRDIVKNLTDYQGLELEVFIRYCNFNKSFISYARTYYLTEAVQKKYLEFEKKKVLEYNK